MAVRTIQAPPDSGELVLGRTLPSLLHEAVTANPNPRALNQRVGDRWEPTSTLELQRSSSAMALGLRASGLSRGDRVAFFTESDVSFVIGDLACLQAGLVSVPIYLTESPHDIRHILSESGCRALLVSTPAHLARFAPALEDSAIELVAAWQPPEGIDAGAPPASSGSAGASGRAWPAGLPASLRLTSYAELQRLGAATGSVPDALAAEIDAQDLATILYTSGTTGTPKGVMLSHQNISSNIIACFTGLPTFYRGPQEVVLSFLPLTHIFARTLQYGMMWYGSSVYFGDAKRVPDDLREVRPTFFAAVPRVLEKAHDRIQAVGAELTGLKRRIFDAAMAHARAFDTEMPPQGVAALRHRFFDRLVYSKWRDALGGRTRTIIIGGAALRAELATTFCAAGLDVLQGYGLTETSPVITFSRPGHNRPGAVGTPVAGTEVGLSEDGEILARGPYVMLGYYRDPERTAEVIDADGWLHTGDLGSFDDDGLLRVIGRIKHMFKLSTGKYVMPQPLEERIEVHPLVATALVVGEGQKYCAALVFVEPSAVEPKGGRAAALRGLVAAANLDLPPWSTIKRFAVITDELTSESGAVTPKLSIRRHTVLLQYDAVVEAMYRVAGPVPATGVAIGGDPPAARVFEP